MIDLLGHVFYLCLFLGMYLLAKKKKVGWFFRFVGELGWTSLGLALGLSSIVIWGIIFMVIDAFGYYHWRKHENTISQSKGPESTKIR